MYTVSSVEIKLIPLGKAATRLPEAMWVGFSPPQRQHEVWSLDKMGTVVTFNETVKNGSRYLHGVDSGVSLGMEKRPPRFTVRSADTALVAPKLQAEIPLFEAGTPDDTAGIAYNLFNNGWLCNYVIWCGNFDILLDHFSRIVRSIPSHRADDVLTWCSCLWDAASNVRAIRF